MSKISHTTDHFQRDDNHATAACESSLFISRCSITGGQKGLSGFDTGLSSPSFCFGLRTIATCYLLVNPFFSLFKTFLFRFSQFPIRPYSVVFLRYFRSSALQRSALYAGRLGMSNIFFTFSSFFLKNLQKTRFSAGFKNAFFCLKNQKQLKLIT